MVGVDDDRCPGPRTSVSINTGGSSSSAVKVKLVRPRAGRFTRLTVTYQRVSTTVLYRLGTASGDPAWVPADTCGDPDLARVCF